MAIRWEKFTVKSQEAVQAASELAAEHGNPEILPLHLLAALVDDKDGIIVPVLKRSACLRRSCARRCRTLWRSCPK